MFRSVRLLYRQPYKQPTEQPRPLEHPITYTEVEHSLNRASGSGELSGELLKCESEILGKPIVDIFNRALPEQQTRSQLGHGVLILLSKPGQPVGAMASLKPFVLLTALRKMLSLVVLAQQTTLKEKRISTMQMSYLAIVG